MSPFMLKVTECHRAKCAAFIEELLTGMGNFVELSTFYQPLKPVEGEGIGYKVPSATAVPKSSQAILFSPHHLNAPKVSFGTGA